MWTQPALELQQSERRHKRDQRRHHSTSQSLSDAQRHLHNPHLDQRNPKSYTLHHVRSSSAQNTNSSHRNNFKRPFQPKDTRGSHYSLNEPVVKGNILPNARGDDSVLSSSVNKHQTSAIMSKEEYTLETRAAQTAKHTVHTRSDNKPVRLHHRPRVKPATGRDPESELTRAFDPMKDRHMWTMWRTAVTGRIVDEVRRLEDNKSFQDEDEFYGAYGSALTTPPLRRFIRLSEGSKEIAQDLMNRGQGRLLASQFVYFGLPRACVRYDSDMNNNRHVNERL